MNPDTRNPDAWIFLAYENDTDGGVGSGYGGLCQGSEAVGVYEAYDFSGGNDDSSISGVYNFRSII